MRGVHAPASRHTFICASVSRTVELGSRAIFCWAAVVNSKGKTCTSNIASYLSLILYPQVQMLFSWTPATLLSFRILLHVGKLKDIVIGIEYNV